MIVKVLDFTCIVLFCYYCLQICCLFATVSYLQRNAVHHVNVQNIKVSFIMSVKLFLSLVAFNSIKTFGIVLRSTKQGDDCAKKKFILASDAIQSVIKVPRRPRV